MRIDRATCLGIVVLLSAGWLQAAGPATESNPAVEAEVQTAEWAQSWWMPRHEEKLAELKARDRVDLVFLGDSITHGWENRGKQTWDAYYAKRNALNLGFSGDRTEQVLWRLQHGAVAGIQPQLAVVMIGTNNAGHRQDPPEQTAAGVQAIVEELRARLPATKILLLAIFPRGATPEDPLRKLNDATNRRIAELADQRRVFYLDLSPHFLDAQGQLPKAIMPDLLHPNEEGYAIWAKAMEPTVARLLGESKPAPNVILILTDDQGTIDARCFGADDLATPGIDGLAERGVRFTQFYAAAPVCSPSRAGLLTGRYPVRAGVPGNVSSQEGVAGMPAQQVTIAETFRAAGYATAQIGKWHLGYSPETMPNGQGFDHSFGHMGGCIDNYSHFFYWQGPNRHDLWRNGQEVFQEGRFFVDLMLEEALAFIEQHREQPFFMYFAINMPHYPYQGQPHWLEYYQDLPHPRNLYAAFVSTLDARIARLEQAVTRMGLRERTIFAFQSDHGHSCEERAHGGGGSAGPYRGAKFSLFEGGIRVPAVISWPGQLPENETRNHVAHSCDWLPTLAELCGVPLLRDDGDGASLVPLLRDAEADSPHDTLHWTSGNSWAVRQGSWKLIANPRDTSARGPIEKGVTRYLVNLDEDPGEQVNQASEQPQVLQRLEQLHADWQSSLEPQP